MSAPATASAMYSLQARSHAFTVEERNHPLQSLMDTGASDCLSGAMPWNNPYPSGSWQAYAWDKGHSEVRGESVQ